MVSVLRESGSYIWLKFYGRTIKTTKNSIVHRLLPKLEEFLNTLEVKAFTTTEFREFCNVEDVEAFKLFSQLKKQRAIFTTKKRVMFRTSTNLEHVWGLTQEDILKYVLNRLQEERPDLVEDFHRLQEERVLSSLEIYNPQQFRIYFVNALGIVNVVSHTNYDIFYIGSKESLKELIRVKEHETNYLIHQKVKKGLAFERYVEGFFRRHMHDLTFKCVKISRYERRELRDRTRVFDLVLYFRAYVGDKEIKGFPTLIVPIEIKRTDTGQAILLKHLIECKEVFSHNFLPVVVTNSPRRSAFDTCSMYHIGLLLEKDLEKLEEGGVIAGEGIEGEGREDTEAVAEWTSDS
ncbi:hypothetical protein [Geoglobus ahangari]